MADQGDEYYKNFSEPVRNYMASRGTNPAGLMRILQRLGLPLPPTPAEGHSSIAGFINENGEEEFLMRMGQVRSRSRITPSPDQPQVALKWKKKMSPASRLTVETVGSLPADPDIQRTPEAPMLPPSAPSTGSIKEFVLDLEEEDDEEHDAHLPVKKAEPKPEEAGPAPAATTQPDLSDDDLPEILMGFPASAITEQARNAAANGASPFGPPPLIDRRSGLDRRSGRDRRAATELVFRNSRYGSDRRSGEDRRAVPPPYRDRSIPVEECIGNPELKRLGWTPPIAEKSADNEPHQDGAGSSPALESANEN